MTQPVPPEPIPNATTYSTQDTEHLRLLRIFWYIWAGITGFFSCIFIVHIVMGIVFVVCVMFLKGGFARHLTRLWNGLWRGRGVRDRGGEDVPATVRSEVET